MTLIHMRPRTSGDETPPDPQWSSLGVTAGTETDSVEGGLSAEAALRDGQSVGGEEEEEREQDGSEHVCSCFQW